MYVPKTYETFSHFKYHNKYRPVQFSLVLNVQVGFVSGIARHWDVQDLCFWFLAISTLPLQDLSNVKNNFQNFRFLQHLDKIPCNINPSHPRLFTLSFSLGLWPRSISGYYVMLCYVWSPWYPLFTSRAHLDTWVPACFGGRCGLMVCKALSYDQLYRVCHAKSPISLFSMFIIVSPPVPCTICLGLGLIVFRIIFLLDTTVCF